MAVRDSRALVMHVVHRFDTGGLENGVVNLINHLPADAYRHAIVALTEVGDFRRRIVREDVECVSLHKGPGHALWLYPRLYALMRRMRPAIVHTRNLAALEATVPAWLAGVPLRIHGEHGRDVGDLDGSSRRHQWVRRLYRPFVSHYVALSRELARYLVERIGVPPQRVTLLCNGVDTARFRPPAASAPEAIPGCAFDPARHFIVGTVGRMQAVKSQTTLVRAFVHALQRQPSLGETLRLVLVGDGPLRAQCRALLVQAGVASLAWLPGERSDVPQLMRGLHLFVLPSLAEGISNTILEAMASGLPVIATDVGGNAELVSDGRTGRIVPADDVPAMAEALAALAGAPEQARAMGHAARARAESRFSLSRMVAAYRKIYDGELGGAPQPIGA